MSPIYIIEHLEPQLWPWCLIEYESLSKAAGKQNVWFTNIQKKDVKKLQRFGKVFTESIRDMTIDMSKACILEPLAPKTLSPQDAKQFNYYIFGGILGDAKLNGRTQRELSRFLSHAHQRNIGKEQFSTDNAVYITHQIAQGKKLADIAFQDAIEININKVESVILPYRYPVVKGKPRISPKLVTYLKNKKGF
jgi:ribosome biogenesis SPOUT family RNA methylase Rps3